MNYYTPERIEQGIQEFARRAEVEPEYCRELFEHSTVRILSHKYAYYILGKHYVGDDSYDCEEKSWYVMARGLGLAREDETSPCVGWNAEHPLAQRAIALAEQMLK